MRMGRRAQVTTACLERDADLFWGAGGNRVLGPDDAGAAIGSAAGGSGRFRCPDRRGRPVVVGGDDADGEETASSVSS